MSKPWYAFSKRAIVCAVSFAQILTVSALAVEPTPAPSSQVAMVELVFKSGTGNQQMPFVGDVVPYELRNAPSDWQIDPKEGALTKGFLFRKGKLFIPLVPGKVQLPSLSVVNPSGEVVAKTDPVEVGAQSNLPQAAPGAEPPKPEPAIGPLGLPFPLWIQSVVAFALLGVVLVAAFFVLRALKRRAAKAIKSLIPKKPYDQLSIERLDALLKEDLKDPKKLKKFYFTISEVLKFYLGERYSMDAEESTTSELLVLLRERTGISGLSEILVGRIEKLFRSLDPVKFADVVPSAEEAKAVQREAKEIVLTTRREESKITPKMDEKGVKK